MGNLCGKSTPSKGTQAENVRDRILKQDLEVAKRQDDLKVKLLLLGAGESGKSTLFKQMKINYMDTYSKADLIDAKDRIIHSFVEAFIEILKAVQDQFGSLENDRLEQLAHLVTNSDVKTGGKKFLLTTDLAKALKELWNSDRVQRIWDKRSNFQVLDSLSHFCNSIDRFASPDYIPTEEDYLLCRVRTSGILEQTFTYNKVKFVIVDVGGQRSERRKWIQCFDNVTAVIFVAAVSEFDQKLFEDAKVNRIAEATTLFANTLNFRVFRTTPMILFLNKVDLFEAKMRRLESMGANLDDFFPSLRLGTNYEGAQKIILEHLKYEFESKAKPGRVFSHYVTATDKNTFKTVFKATAQIILSRTINDHFNK